MARLSKVGRITYVFRQYNVSRAPKFHSRIGAQLTVIAE